MKNHLPSDAFEVFEGLIFLFILLYLIAPYVGNIFEFIGTVLYYSFIGIVLIFVMPIIYSIIVSTLEDLETWIWKELQRYDPRIAKDIEF